MPSWALWLGCVGLLLLRALMGAAESALSGVSDLKAKELATQHGRAGRRVLRLRTHRETTASSLRIGMVLSGFLAAGVGALAPPAMVQFDVSRLGGCGAAALVARRFAGGGARSVRPSAPGRREPRPPAFQDPGAVRTSAAARGRA